jgi:hypothetical protein
MAITDNLNPPPSPTRVYYSLGRMLAAEDFQADQDYHRGSLARVLMQLYGTGTVAGLYVRMPQVWQPQTAYVQWTFVFDTSNNVQVNTGGVGVSEASVTFNQTVGGTVTDGATIVWTNYGPLETGAVINTWQPNRAFSPFTAIVDSNSNVQVLTAAAGFISGSAPPVWRRAVSATTSDGNPSVSAWTCVGPSQLEVEVTAGLAIDRVGRMIESPSTVCIFLQPWLASQSISDQNSAVKNGNMLVDVFAGFVPCTQGVTPCFATQDDYDSTDAFSPNRLLDSFSMQLILRTDSSPQLPQDPWSGAGTVPTGGVTADVVKALKQHILQNDGAPTPVEYPPIPGFDTTSVFLARLSIPATLVAGIAPELNLNAILIDNLSRLFLYPASLVARSVGLSSGS